MTRLVQYYNSPLNTLDRAFGALFAPTNGDATAATRGSFPLDVVETADAYVITAEIPGVAKDKIEVKVDDRDVTISYETREDNPAEGSKALWRERSFGKVYRALRLPESVDANGAQAKHADGVLELTLPKFAKANVKQITIQ